MTGTNAWEDDDEVWGDDEPGQLGQVKRENINAGYLAGVTAAKVESVQSGFDDGYPHGADLGRVAGSIIGVLQGLGLKDLEDAAVKDMSPGNLFNLRYYDDQAKPKFEGMHPVIIKWKNTAESMASSW